MVYLCRFRLSNLCQFSARALTCRNTVRAAVTAPLYCNRQFSVSSVALAKKKKGGKKGVNDATEDSVEEVDTKKLSQQAQKEFEKCIETYSKKTTEIKMGKANPDIFNELDVKMAHGGSAKFPQVAQTAMRSGKYLTVTVFSPSDTKNVVSAILGANLNLNPEVDPKNPQLLKVLLPTTTRDLKAKEARELKELTDDFKSSHSNRLSLAAIRGKYMRQIKKTDGSKDVVHKMEQDLEKLYKNYASELASAYKASEKALK